jgi:peptidoglycan hydrolase CwlO-like protein
MQQEADIIQALEQRAESLEREKESLRRTFAAEEQRPSAIPDPHANQLEQQVANLKRELFKVKSQQTNTDARVPNAPSGKDHEFGRVKAMVEKMDAEDRRRKETRCVRRTPTSNGWQTSCISGRLGRMTSSWLGDSIPQERV